MNIPDLFPALEPAPGTDPSFAVLFALLVFACGVLVCLVTLQLVIWIRGARRGRPQGPTP